MVKTVEDTFGPISVLVNNAGVAGQALFQDVTDALWERYFAVNLTGARNTIQAVLPHMLHEKAGDAFAPRNKYALKIDDEIDPPMFKISDTHFAATWLLDPRAPKVEMPPELKDRVARMSAEAKKIEEAE